MISFEDFQKINLKVARIVEASRVEDSNKLMKLEIDLGKEKRQLVAGIAKAYTADELEGREIIVVANLEPKEIFSLQSQGMLLAADSDQPVLLQPDQEVEPGTKIT
ncbi:MAG: methionine--tRNA ligase subunit beta [Candidatus Paceibacterota bacterium]